MFIMLTEKVKEQTVQQRSGLALRHASNFTLFPVRTERFKASFFPSTTMLWNSMDYNERSTLSISVFKQNLNRFFLYFML